MGFKTALAIVSLLSDFFLTGWIMNWAPINRMLTESSYFSGGCTQENLENCNYQQVHIATLWSFVLLSELTVLPCGIMMDCFGPVLFSLFISFVHVGSLVSLYYLPKNSDYLIIPFFFLGMVAQAIFLLATRVVYIFNSREARKRWVVACVTLFDTSAICTMFFYELWDVNILEIKDVFIILAVIGGVLLGVQCVCWIGIRRETYAANDVVMMVETPTLGVISKDLVMIETPPLREKYIPTQYDELEEIVVPVSEIFCGCKFYFFIILCALNIFRIRYFLGLAVYTLIYLDDRGTYLHILGYCFALSMVFSPLADKTVRKLESWGAQFHIMNGVITMYFITWMIPNLPVQIVTFTLFIIGRLFCFTVLTAFATAEFSEKRVGLVIGSGFMLAAIPGAFMYVIVDVGLDDFDGNFWLFHLMCIFLGLVASLIIWVMEQKLQLKA